MISSEVAFTLTRQDVYRAVSWLVLRRMWPSFLAGVGLLLVVFSLIAGWPLRLVEPGMWLVYAAGFATMWPLMVLGGSVVTIQNAVKGRSWVGDWRYVFSDEGIDSSLGEATSQIAWSHVTRLSENGDYLFLWIGKQPSRIFPKRTMDPAALEQVRRLLAEGMSRASVAGIGRTETEGLVIRYRLSLRAILRGNAWFLVRKGGVTYVGFVLVGVLALGASLASDGVVSFVLFPVAMFLLVCGPGFFLLGFTLFSFNTWKAQVTYGEAVYVFDDVGIAFQAPGAGGKTSWKTVDRVQEHRRYLYIWIGQLMVIIPTEQLAAGDVQELRRLIRENAMGKMELRSER